MNLCLCCINSKYVHSSLAPWYLAAALQGVENCQVSIVEATINQKEEEIIQKILHNRLEAVAFCCYIWNIEMVHSIVTRFHALRPEIPIILGGPEVTFRSREILQQWPEVSYVICGEGEESLPALVKAWEQYENPQGIPGIAGRMPEGRLFYTPAEPLSTLPPDPYSEQYLATLQGRIAYLETTRGCPFSCSFCLSGVKEKVRFFDLEQSKRNLVKLANSGAKTVKFIDRTFNCHPARAYELVAFILEQSGKAFPRDVRFHFEVGADLFEPRFVELLSTAPPGLLQIEAGLQSFHAETLEAVDRKTDLQRLINNLKACIQPHNVHVHIDLIAGLPYEDYQTFAKSFDQAFALRPHMLQLGFLKLLYGSKIRRQAEEIPEFGYCFSSKAPYEVQKTHWISQHELEKLHEVEDALERMYNSGRFLQTLDYLLQVTEWSPFALFEAFGHYAKQQGVAAGICLDTYTEWIWRFFKQQSGVQPEKLRDCLVMDRLSCDNTGRIPPLLRREDHRLKYAKQKARKLFPDQGKLGVALLYHPWRIAVFDYRDWDVITGRYAMHVFDDEDIEKMGREK